MNAATVDGSYGAIEKENLAVATMKGRILRRETALRDFWRPYRGRVNQKKSIPLKIIILYLYRNVNEYYIFLQKIIQNVLNLLEITPDNSNFLFVKCGIWVFTTDDP